MNIERNQLLTVLSEALDCVEKEVFGITDHHAKRVAWLCIQMGKQANMTDDEISDMAIGALLHDNALNEYRTDYEHGKLREGASSRCVAAQTQRCTECTRLPGSLGAWCTPCTRLPGSLAGVCSPTHPEADSLAPSSCLTHVASLALSSPAETCAAGWGLPLRAWAPAHSPSSGQAAPELRHSGGAERPHLEAE